MASTQNQMQIKILKVFKHKQSPDSQQNNLYFEVLIGKNSKPIMMSYQNIRALYPYTLLKYFQQNITAQLKLKPQDNQLQALKQRQEQKQTDAEPRLFDYDNFIRSNSSILQTLNSLTEIYIDEYSGRLIRQRVFEGYLKRLHNCGMTQEKKQDNEQKQQKLEKNKIKRLGSKKLNN